MASARALGMTLVAAAVALSTIARARTSGAYSAGVSTPTAPDACLDTGEYGAGGTGENPGGGSAYGGSGAGLPGMDNGFGPPAGRRAPVNPCTFGEYGAGGSGENPGGGGAYGGWLGLGAPGMNNGFGVAVPFPP